MRFLGTPFAALSASFFTWYLVEQSPPTRQESASEMPEGAAEDGDYEETLRRLQEQIAQKDEQIRELKSGGDEKELPRNEFVEFYRAGQRCFAILQDGASYTAHRAAAHIWPWPSQQVLLPDLQQQVAYFRRAGEHIEPYAKQARSAVDDLSRRIPPEVSQTALEVLGSVKAAANASALTIEAAVDDFLQTHPQHRHSLQGFHPALLLLLLVITLCQMWAVMCLLRGPCLFLLKLPFKVFCCSCFSGKSRTPPEHKGSQEFPKSQSKAVKETSGSRSGRKAGA
eukprot:TRINITY_DN106931_c0_g1_i1.p1 TRINITY_DN106931_c0_g1~~TRINITY_DN106931_c0_g1_i1.p1  ORF type:complete len:308 (-),score=67.72 TRINITY_DN106931_c0_g1_i1:256-1104(-)